jgi:hypothetical protein
MTQNRAWIQEYEEREADELMQLLIYSCVRFRYDPEFHEVIAMETIPPHHVKEKCEICDEGRLLPYIIHIDYPACERGTVLHDIHCQGLYDLARDYPDISIALAYKISSKTNNWC